MDGFNNFTKFMSEGLKKGEKEYGKYSFLSQSTEKHLIDIQEECRDIANYAYMLWYKVEQLKNVENGKTRNI